MLTLVAFFTFSLLPQTKALDFSLNCSGPVVATVGEQATLSCQVQPQTQKDMDVIWSNVTVELHNQEGGYVHVFRNGADDPHLQHDQFKGRTKLDHQQLKKGNISLTIFNVFENYTGTYRCLVEFSDISGKIHGTVELKVRPKSIDEGQRDTKVTSGNTTTEGPKDECNCVTVGVTVGVIVGVIVGVVVAILAGLVGLMVFQKKRLLSWIRGNRGAAQPQQIPLDEPNPQRPLQDDNQEQEPLHDHDDVPNPDNQEQEPLHKHDDDPNPANQEQD